MSFHDFWTNENNPKLDKSQYLYGTRHIICLVIVAVLCVLLCAIFYKKSQRAKRILLIVLSCILLFFEIASRVVNLIIEENYTWESVLKILLPMHICSVMVWVLIVGVFSKKQVLYDFGAIGGFLATFGFLLYPAVGLNRTYMSFTCIYSTVSHMTGFVCVILLLVLGIAKFEWKKIWQPFVCFAVMFAWGALLNFVIFPGSDYMYMVNDPLELDLNFPFQILYLGIIIVYTTLFYVVYNIKERIKSKRKNR